MATILHTFAQVWPSDAVQREDAREHWQHHARQPWFQHLHQACNAAPGRRRCSSHWCILGDSHQPRGPGVTSLPLPCMQLGLLYMWEQHRSQTPNHSSHRAAACARHGGAAAVRQEGSERRHARRIPSQACPLASDEVWFAAPFHTTLHPRKRASTIMTIPLVYQREQHVHATVFKPHCTPRNRPWQEDGPGSDVMHPDGNAQMHRCSSRVCSALPCLHTAGRRAVYLTCLLHTNSEDAPSAICFAWARCAHDSLQHGVVQGDNQIVPGATRRVGARRRHQTGSLFCVIEGTSVYASTVLHKRTALVTAHLSKSAYSKGSRGRVKIFGRTPSCAAWLISAAVVAGVLSVVCTATPAVCGSRARP